MRHLLLSVAIATNQLINAATGGDPQMSISARAAFAREHGSKLGKFWCGTFDKFDHHHLSTYYPSDADHCDIAIIDYRDRKGKVK
jgi:hypothetical protein